MREGAESVDGLSPVERGFERWARRCSPGFLHKLAIAVCTSWPTRPPTRARVRLLRPPQSRARHAPHHQKNQRFRHDRPIRPNPRLTQYNTAPPTSRASSHLRVRAATAPTVTGGIHKAARGPRLPARRRPPSRTLPRPSACVSSRRHPSAERRAAGRTAALHVPAYLGRRMPARSVPTPPSRPRPQRAHRSSHSETGYSKQNINGSPPCGQCRRTGRRYSENHITAVEFT